MSTLHARKAALGFKGYDDFQPVLTAVRLAARAELGFRWDLSPDCQWARLPAKWCRAPIFGRIAKCPRDQKLPPARFWPNGQFPAGAELAEPQRKETHPMVAEEGRPTYTDTCIEHASYGTPQRLTFQVRVF